MEELYKTIIQALHFLRGYEEFFDGLSPVDEFWKYDVTWGTNTEARISVLETMLSLIERK